MRRKSAIWKKNSLFTAPRRLICEIIRELDEGVIEHGVDPAATAPAICRGSENVSGNLPPLQMNESILAKQILIVGTHFLFKVPQ